MAGVKTVGLMCKPRVPHARDLVVQLVKWLEQRGLEVCLDEQAAEYAGREPGLPREEVAERSDLVIVLGGDGTLLAAARAVGNRDVPILPVNLGGLGFLTAVSVDEMYTELERFLQGESRIGFRRMLHCEVVRDGSVVATYEALNDAVVTKASLARMIDLEVFINQNFVCHYKADGLIVATPTGSTAYSLAAGGPIIYPTVEGLCLTPICPHMLTNRPVIVPDTSLITVVNLAESDEAYLTIDGQVGEPLKKYDQVTCRRSDHCLKLVRPPQLRYFDVLRQKLKWGER